MFNSQNKGQSARERIYQEIRDRISYCKLNPGERLVESVLADKFGASRSPIREALRQLESEGLLTFERNKGNRVSKLSVKQVDEIYNIRWLIESYATSLAAENATKKQIDYLDDLNRKLYKAVSGNDLKSWLHCNTLFHTFFYDNCRNDNLQAILNTLHLRIHRYKYITISLPGHFEDYRTEHEGIVNGCRERDGKLAERYMKRHIETIKEVLIQHLNAFPDLMT
jgi:DNA-binding GntR family transcriptional regulator